jgi:subtilisin-like proprotein convertase family protein
MSHGRRLLLVLLVGLLALPLAQATHPADAKKKFKTVTKTFANPGEIVIPEDGVEGSGPALPYPASIPVSGFKKANITDVNLTLHNYSHEFTPDVDVLLVAPGGRNATVMSDVGIFEEPSPASSLTLTLDDEASLPLPIDAPPTSGTFRPLDAFGDSDTLLAFPAPAPAPSGSDALSTFDGIDPNGEWQLFILDDTGGDEGAVDDGWSLTIAAKLKKKKKR